MGNDDAIDQFQIAINAFDSKKEKNEMRQLLKFK